MEEDGSPRFDFLRRDFNLGVFGVGVVVGIVVGFDVDGFGVVPDAMRFSSQ